MSFVPTVFKGEVPLFSFCFSKLFPFLLSVQMSGDHCLLIDLSDSDSGSGPDFVISEVSIRFVHFLGFSLTEFADF